MSKAVSIELVWNFMPENYFVKPITIQIEGGEIKICKGQVSAKIDYSVFNRNRDLMDSLDDLVEDQFFAIQNKTHESYELSIPLKIEIRDDGTEKPCLM